MIKENLVDAVAAKDLIDSYIKDRFSEERLDHSLYEPCKYIMDLPGKRIRPVLVILSFQCFQKGRNSEVLPIALGAELFHNFSLIHDDIMDKADLRRGQPTVHKKWDEDIAILSGDAMFALAMELFAEGKPEYLPALVKEFTSISLGVCEGQMEDLELPLKENATIEDYLEMIRKKTAVLIGGSLALGAIAGGANAEISEKIREFGECLGIAFQLQDDHLDAFGDSPQIGKVKGGDILQNKKTFMLLRSIELANTETRIRILGLIAQKDSPDKKVVEMLEIFETLGIKKQSEEKIHSYFSRAMELGKELENLDGFSMISEYLMRLTKRTF